MAANKRKIGIYSIAGIAAAIVIIASFLASGIQLPGQQSLGTLVVSIKDAPVDLEHLWVTIDGLMVQSSDNGWIELKLNENQQVPFDLLALIDAEHSLKLSEQTLDTGEYSKIRLEGVTATTTIGGEPLNVPPGHIDIITNFHIEAGKLTALMIDMQPDTAAISQSGNFKPIVKAIVTPAVVPTEPPTSSSGSPSP